MILHSHPSQFSHHCHQSNFAFAPPTVQRSSLLRLNFIRRKIIPEITGQLCFPGGSVAKNPPASGVNKEKRIQSLGREDPVEKEVATHSSILAQKIPWREEPGRLQSMGVQKSDTILQLNNRQATLKTVCLETGNVMNSSSWKQIDFFNIYFLFIIIVSFIAFNSYFYIFYLYGPISYT